MQFYMISRNQNASDQIQPRRSHRSSGLNIARWLWNGLWQTSATKSGDFSKVYFWQSALFLPGRRCFSELQKTFQYRLSTRQRSIKDWHCHYRFHSCHRQTFRPVSYRCFWLCIIITYPVLFVGIILQGSLSREHKHYRKRQSSSITNSLIHP